MCCSFSGDQRAAHDSGKSVSVEQLKDLGVLYWHVPRTDDWEDQISTLSSCGYRLKHGTYPCCFSPCRCDREGARLQERGSRKLDLEGSDESTR
jgi:hypothetical protein